MTSVQVSSLAAGFDLTGRTGLVVGGYGGIGTAVSALLADAGLTTIVAGRSSERAAATAIALAGRRGDVRPEALDVSDRDQVEACVQRVLEAHGRLDVVVNLAAVDVQGPAEDVESSAWDAVMAVNLSGAFWLAQAAGRAMLRQGEGRIILFSSTRSAYGGRRGFAPYGASKAGVNLLVKQLATEWGPHGITVNAIAPGFVPTALVSARSADEGFLEMLRQRIPLGRFATAEEIAAPTLFLASPASSFVNGQVLYVDGGVTASS